LNRRLCTIGYTGFRLEEFVACLKEAQVEYLIDIREIPLSRKKGFSKTALSGRLQEDGIDYRHFRLLGSPRELRHAVRDDRDYESFFRGVDAHLKKPDSQLQLTEAIKIARSAKACLMCCCDDWQFCHRKCVVDAVLSHTLFFVNHLAIESTPAIRRAA